MPIELKAVVLIQNDGRVLVSKGFDKVKQQPFYRLLGGHVEFTEAAESAVRREILEEIGSEIEGLKLVGVIENIFTHHGEQGHEIDYLYTGTLTRVELYEQNPIRQQEDGEFQYAEWVPIKEILGGEIPLYSPYDYKTQLENPEHLR